MGKFDDVDLGSRQTMERMVKEHARNCPVVSNHSLIGIAGRDSKGNYTQLWMTSTQPMDLMAELKHYKEIFPDLSRIEITIDCHDKDRNKPIHFGEYPPPRNTG